MRTKIAILLGLMLAGRGLAVQAEIIDRVLAILPGQIITQSDVEGAIDLELVQVPANGDRLAMGLSAVIDRVLMLNEVRRVQPPEPAAAAVDARLARMRQRFRSAAEMSQTLVIRGLDEDMLRSHATEDVRLSIYLDERFSAASQPTEQELKEVGEANRQSFVDELRRALIAAWTAELRRRTEVTVVEK
jgi:hypothetical protein